MSVFVPVSLPNCTFCRSNTQPATSLLSDLNPYSQKNYFLKIETNKRIHKRSSRQYIMWTTIKIKSKAFQEVRGILSNKL